jgi:hypothetical protein
MEILICAVLVLGCHTEHSSLIDSICVVESNCDSTAIGAAGEIGAYQILECYWKDAVEHDPSIGGVYSDCLDKEYSKKVILSYWDRYCTEKRLGRKPTDEDRARIHNGGPNGYKKSSTLQYWKKIKAQL